MLRENKHFPQNARYYDSEQINSDGILSAKALSTISQNWNQSKFLSDPDRQGFLMFSNEDKYFRGEKDYEKLYIHQWQEKQRSIFSMPRWRIGWTPVMSSIGFLKSAFEASFTLILCNLMLHIYRMSRSENLLDHCHFTSVITHLAWLVAYANLWSNLITLTIHSFLFKLYKILLPFKNHSMQLLFLVIIIFF